MDIQKINQYKTTFDNIANKIVGDDGSVVEVWYARDLQTVLGYARWENFTVAVNRYIYSCKTLSISLYDHFREVTKMVMLGSGSQRSIKDFILNRYACYLVAQNGDPLIKNYIFKRWNTARLMIWNSVCCNKQHLQIRWMIVK